MRSTSHAPCLLLVFAFLCTSAAGTAWAKLDPPSSPSDQHEAEQNPPAFLPSEQVAARVNTAAGVATATRSARTDQQSLSADEGTATKVQASAVPQATAVSVARWFRAIGGRISIGPKVDRTTRVSLPKPTDARQGWRVSTPNFAHARLVRPPERAAPPKAATPDNTAQSDAIEPAPEPATNE